MVNIDIIFESIKLAWLKSLSTSKYQPVVNVYFKYISLGLFINFSYGIGDIPSNLPRFYKQILEIWYQFKKECCKFNLNKVFGLMNMSYVIRKFCFMKIFMLKI